MPKSKVTAKYQVTIPREVRDRIGVKAGEVVSIEAISKSEIRLRRLPGVSNPMGILVGSVRGHKRISVEELEERAETR